MIGKAHLPCSNNQPSFYLPQHDSYMSFTASISNLDFQSKLCRSQDITTLSPQHMTIPTSTACHNQVIYCFIQTQHWHLVFSSYSILQMYSTHCSCNVMCYVMCSYLSFTKFPSHLFSKAPHSTPIQYACPTVSWLSKRALYDTYLHTVAQNIPYIEQPTKILC